ncbi:kinase A anchor protein [Limtongia smithiae]|uniref:kinase A anchor protein n=1 Tax=Limtongia smithiae TaxID=1125753 RepID=UPI0034CE5BF2
MSSAAARGPPTHFLALPLVPAFPAPIPARIVNGLYHLCERCCSNDAVQIVDPCAIRPARTLHLTIAIARWPTPEAVREGVAALRAFGVERQADRGMAVRLRGLRMFPGANTKRANVVFAGVEDLSRGRKGTSVQEFADSVRIYFDERGLLLPENKRKKSGRNRNNGGSQDPKEDEKEEGVVLHATMINTVYATTRSSRGTPSLNNTERLGINARRGGRPSFDATALLAEFQNFDFSDTIQINRLEICKMGQRSEQDGGGYQCIAHIDI